MWIVAGLGNPSEKYEGTRHNAGFEVIDRLADKYDISVSDRKHRSFMGQGKISDQDVILVKPQTYMNLSGESIEGFVREYALDMAEQFLVIYDDVDLVTGQIRVREKGSAGSHNGMRNIIDRTGTENFKRIRVGIGDQPKDVDRVSFVLGRFSREEKERMDEAYENAVRAVEMILSGDTSGAMNAFNRKKEAEEES